MVLKPNKLKKKVNFRELASYLQTNSSTLYSWTDRVPVWRVQAIEDFCKQKNIDISDCYEGEQ